MVVARDKATPPCPTSFFFTAISVSAAKSSNSFLKEGKRSNYSLPTSSPRPHWVLYTTPSLPAPHTLWPHCGLPTLFPHSKLQECRNASAVSAVLTATFKIWQPLLTSWEGWRPSQPVNSSFWEKLASQNWLLARKNWLLNNKNGCYELNMATNQPYMVPKNTKIFNF